MSKTINPERMSKFDRQYLRDRNIDPEEYAARFTLTEDDEVEEAEVEEGQEPARLGEAETDEDSDDEEDVPYSQWKVGELRAELKNRELDTTGEKGDLIARLEAHDAEQGDDSTP